MEIILSMQQHKGEERVFLHFPFNSQLNLIVKKIAGVRWSQTRKLWHLPVSKQAIGNLQEQTKEFASINVQELKKQFVEGRKNNLTHNHLPPPLPQKTFKSHSTVSIGRISDGNHAELQRFTDCLRLKAYSPSTIRTYSNEFLQLLYLLGDIEVQNLQAQHVKRYLLYCLNNGIKENTIHSRLNALKFYFERVLNRQKFFVEIPRPKKPQLLPKLLNESELARLFNAVANKKHKAMLFTAYSAGLRVSEVVNLKIADIDSKRMQIFVARAKGKKDRYVNLSPVLLDILRQYMREYKPRPKHYLFESEQTFTAYPTRTIQQIFANAKNRAGIRKEVGMHSLRHSFATHLLDRGTDIKYIKELLGHFNIKTTERYLHVSKKQLVNIVSPFDELWKKENIRW